MNSEDPNTHQHRAHLADGRLAIAALASVQAQDDDKPAPVNITGKWTMTLELEAFTATPALEFKQDGEKVTGTYTSPGTGRFLSGQAEGPRPRVHGQDVR